MDTASRKPGSDVDDKAPEEHSAERTDVVESDKDLLRGGSGEQGRSRHPATDEDLLHEGSGWSEPADEHRPA